MTPRTAKRKKIEMKVRSSLKSLKNIPGAKLVRRGKRVVVINKANPRAKGRQG